MFRPSESVRCFLARFQARFRSGCLLFLLACLGALEFANAQAKPLSVVLIPGDPTTMTALTAVKRLQPESSFKNVRFHVLPTTRMTEAHVDVLARAAAVGSTAPSASAPPATANNLPELEPAA